MSVQSISDLLPHEKWKADDLTDSQSKDFMAFDIEDDFDQEDDTDEEMDDEEKK